MDSRECQVLQEAAVFGMSLGNVDLSHLSNKVGICNYIRIADEIRKYLPEGKLLDWGCGYGHMTYLLRNRGINAVGYEVQKRNNIEGLPLFSSLDIMYGSFDVALPYKEGTFEGVLSCGTLEHVPEIKRSLREIRRILKNNGIFFTYMLPNRYSWAEKMGEVRGIGVHPVKFTQQEIRKLYEREGFKILKIKRSNVLPKNLTGLPKSIKSLYGLMSPVVINLDHLLSTMPLINIYAGVFEVIAVKE